MRTGNTDKSRPTTLKGCTNILKNDVKPWRDEDSHLIELCFLTKSEGTYLNKFRLKSNIFECLRKLKAYKTDNILLFPDLQVNIKQHINP